MKTASSALIRFGREYTTAAAPRRLWQSVVAATAHVQRRPPAVFSVGSVRHLNLHEYQSKDLMEKFGVVVQKGKMAKTAKEAGDVARWILKTNPKAELVLKAQIHAGGRGKGTFDNGFKGGVKICSTAEQVEEYASKMLGARLITKQTGKEGQLVQKVLINEGINISRELYFAILMDRRHNGEALCEAAAVSFGSRAAGPVIVASTQGGMDIEEVAAKHPNAILTEPVDISTGLTEAQARRLAGKLEIKGGLVEKAVKQFQGLYKMFAATDSTQVEINPLAEASIAGVAHPVAAIFAVDAKLNFDDNAAFRQEGVFGMRDRSMEDPRDVAAEEAGLNFVGLDGDIGCMVNGAGLAMATMDIIKLHGGSPANFLDVGGGATAEQVTKAFKILTSDPKVRAILVNIFGGIMKCDTIANGIITAAKEVHLKVPLVVRLEGTNVELGKDLLRKSGIKIVTADDLDDAAKKAVMQIK